ncbi:(2Fe-2S)-binding protein, partial [Parvibaculum sp.]|uniref:(2Fe-2S)-binding protein n=1 Tax=Parvibaculum sp. TaxID=2024848 RepID=UPI00349FF99B
IVCACFGVGAKRIAQTVAERKLTTVASVGEALGAGTNCGSCRPEIRALIENVLKPEEAA